MTHKWQWTTVASTGLLEYFFGNRILYFFPKLPIGKPLLFVFPSKGTYPIAIFFCFSGWYHGEVMYPTGFPLFVFDMSQKSFA